MRVDRRKRQRVIRVAAGTWRAAAAGWLAACLLFDPSAGQCRDVTFSWSANEEAVDGYRLHYKIGGSGPPYDGSGAAEGPSPINTGNDTSLTLHGLSDRETYSFALTAYAGTSESPYSAEVILPRVQTAPSASAGQISASEDTLYIGRLSGSDPEGDPLTFVLVTDGVKGRVTLNNGVSGDFTYAPLANVNGTDSFTFLVNDGTFDSAPAAMSVAIAPVNDRPAALGTAITVMEGTPFAGQLSAADIEADPLLFSIATNGAKGRATVTDSATGAFSYVPDANAVGGDAFTFRVSDGQSTSAAATVNVTIAAVNDPPVAAAATLSLEEDSSHEGQ